MTSETTPALRLPLLHAAQAQKEITHNEALAMLDIIVAGVVQSGPVNTPPVGPAMGAAWIIGAAPTGLWAGHAKELALYTQGGWRFADVPEGATLHLADGSAARRGGEDWILGEVITDHVKINGDIVLRGRQAAIPNPVTGEVVDSQARAAIESILGALRTHGLIA